MISLVGSKGAPGKTLLTLLSARNPEARAKKANTPKKFSLDDVNRARRDSRIIMI